MANTNKPTDAEIQQMINDKSAVSKQMMREMDAFTEKLNEAGETDFVGCANGWDYSFTRREDAKPKAHS